MPDSFLLNWNPTKSHWDEYAETQESVELGIPVEVRWSCGSRKTLPLGSLVYIMRLGHKQPLHGIFASGVVTEEPFQAPHWNIEAQTTHTNYISFKIHSMLNPDVHLLFQPYFLSDDFDWHQQMSGVFIPEEIASQLEAEWKQHLHDQNLIVEGQSSIPDNSDFWEGKRSMITINRYERDPNARAACIEYYKNKNKGKLICEICEFNFEHTYGSIGKDFIHVHHLVPMGAQEAEYRLNPKTDLLPVCPNCHAMLHRDTPPMTPAELKRLMNID